MLSSAEERHTSTRRKTGVDRFIDVEARVDEDEEETTDFEDFVAYDEENDEIRTVTPILFPHPEDDGFDNFIESFAKRRRIREHTTKDLPTWGLRVSDGKEAKLVRQIQRIIDSGKHTGIISVFSVRKAERWIYIQSESQSRIIDVCKDLIGISVREITCISDEERRKLFEKDKNDPDPEVGSWVRLRSGLYSNDVGLVVSIREDAELCTMQMVPRLKMTKKRRRSKRRPPKLLPLEVLKLTLSSEVTLPSSVPATDTTQPWYSKVKENPKGFEFEGGQYTNAGFLLYECPFRDLDVVLEPSPDEVPEFIKTGIPLSSVYINVGDTVRVYEGEWASHLACVRDVHADGTLSVSILAPSSSTPVEDVPVMDICAKDVTRCFRVGDGVVVRLGAEIGRRGMVIEVGFPGPATEDLADKFKQMVLTVQEYGTSNQFKVPWSYLDTDSNSDRHLNSLSSPPKSKGLTLLYVHTGVHDGKIGFLRDTTDETALVDFGTYGSHWLDRALLIRETDHTNLYDLRAPDYDEETAMFFETRFQNYRAVPPTDVIARKAINKSVYVLHGPHKGRLGTVIGVSMNDALVMFESVIAGIGGQHIPRDDLLMKDGFNLYGERPPGYVEGKASDYRSLFNLKIPSSHPIPQRTQAPPSPPTVSFEPVVNELEAPVDPFHDPTKEGMWIFDPTVAAQRAHYQLCVKILRHRDPRVQFGWVCRSDVAPAHPLATSIPASVPVGYKNSHGNVIVEEIPVEDLRPRAKTSALHLAIGGDQKGRFFKHIRTKDGKARVYPEGSTERADVLEIESCLLCEVKT